MLQNLFCALAVILFCLPSPAQRARGAASMPAAKQVVGYFPGWGAYARRFVVKDLVTRGALGTLTQIDYAQANIHDNLCVLGDPQVDLKIAYKAEDSVDGMADVPAAPVKGNLHQLQLLRARYPKLRVVVSIMGKQSQFEEAAEPGNRATFVRSCVAMFLEGHIAPGVEMGRVFDGIDVDWEYPDADHAEDYIALLKEFRAQMDALRPGSTLSVATGASAKNIAAVDWKRASAPLDQVNAMTYDYGGPWSKVTGFVAPLRSASLTQETVSTAIDGYIAAGVPARKLLMGVPFYAYQWQNVGETGTHGFNAKGDAVRGNWGQRTVASLLASPDAKLYRDPVSLAPWVYDGSTFLTFDDAASLQTKMEFVREKRLGGVMVWELSGDSADGELLRALQ